MQFDHSPRVWLGSPEGQGQKVRSHTVYQWVLLSLIDWCSATCYQRYKRCRWELRVAVITKALIWSAFQRLLSCLQRWRLLKLARRVLQVAFSSNRSHSKAESPSGCWMLNAPPMLSRELKRPEHPYAVDFGLCILFEFFTYSFFVSVRILSESWIC